ncbi:adenine phosphoribosyltransferase [bacterium]|nr:adenine phosphoribosyltransferase [bacterium]
MNLKSSLREVPDFPKPGINFIDITTLLKNPQAFAETVKLLVRSVHGSDINAVVGIEARGFIFGGAVAKELGVGFIPIRKPGKLPAATIHESYELEYGTDSIEMHADALAKGDRVLLLDDLLATGGTMKAAASLIEKVGAEVVKIAFVVELTFLNGRDKLAGYDVISLVTY